MAEPCKHCGGTGLEPFVDGSMRYAEHPVSYTDTDEALAERDARMVAAGRRQAADAIRDAKRRLYARIIANAHLMDKPFTDEPNLSPWDLLKREMAALDRALEGAPAEPVEEAGRG